MLGSKCLSSDGASHIEAGIEPSWRAEMRGFIQTAGHRRIPVGGYHNIYVENTPSSDLHERSFCIFICLLLSEPRELLKSQPGVSACLALLCSMCWNLNRSPSRILVWFSRVQFDPEKHRSISRLKSKYLDLKKLAMDLLFA